MELELSVGNLNGLVDQHKHVDYNDEADWRNKRHEIEMCYTRRLLHNKSCAVTQ